MPFTAQVEAPPLCEDASGALRVGASRVLLELVLRAFQDGASPETIVQRYSTLVLADVHAVIAYYFRHRSEIEEYLALREQKAEEVRQRLESQQGDLGEIRARLLAHQIRSSVAWSMLDIIRKAWGWIGLEPAEVVATSAFGNLIVRAADGTYWRICPEELSCEQVAHHTDEFAALSGEAAFQADWDMSRLVGLARQVFGQLPEGQCYCLKLPAVLGGKYEVANIGAISLSELILFSGDLADQLKDVPDGGQIRIQWAP
jgi:uncharacterized protein (DUF433 family)